MYWTRGSTLKIYKWDSVFSARIESKLIPSNLGSSLTRNKAQLVEPVPIDRTFLLAGGYGVNDSLTYGKAKSAVEAHDSLPRELVMIFI
jgi:hypothetical protein